MILSVLQVHVSVLLDLVDMWGHWSNVIHVSVLLDLVDLWIWGVTGQTIWTRVSRFISYLLYS